MGTCTNCNTLQASILHLEQVNQDLRAQMNHHCCCSTCETLATNIVQLEQENQELRKQIRYFQSQQKKNNSENVVQDHSIQGREYRRNESLETLLSIVNPTPEDHIPMERRRTIYSPLTRLEMQRYGRQLLVKDFGVKSQVKLCDAKVLLIGAGGLGSSIALNLCSMGVGTLGLVDADVVEISNLHRQILHDGSKVGQYKVLSAESRLRDLNPLVKCIPYVTRFTYENALEISADYDIIVDGSDNPTTRYLVNDISILTGKPLISGSALGLEGQVTVFTGQNDDPCYRCLYPKPLAIPMTCSENGVIGVVPGIIGCLQAMETIKVITGMGKPLVGVQCFYDAYDGTCRALKIKGRKNPECKTCKKENRVDLERKFQETKVIDTNIYCEGGCSLDTMQKSNENALESINQMNISTLSLLRTRTNANNEQLQGTESKRPQEYLLIDTRAMDQFSIVHFPEAVNIPLNKIKRTTDLHSLQQLVQMEILQQQPQLISNDDMELFLHNIKPLLFICRRGIYSTEATRLFISLGWTNVKNIDGGYTQYAYGDGGDPSFPMY